MSIPVTRAMNCAMLSATSQRADSDLAEQLSQTEILVIAAEQSRSIRWETIMAALKKSVTAIMFSITARPTAPSFPGRAVRNESRSPRTEASLKWRIQAVA